MGLAGSELSQVGHRDEYEVLEGLDRNSAVCIASDGGGPADGAAAVDVPEN